MASALLTPAEPSQQLVLTPLTHGLTRWIVLRKLKSSDKGARSKILAHIEWQVTVVIIH